MNYLIDNLSKLITMLIILLIDNNPLDMFDPTKLLHVIDLEVSEAYLLYIYTSINKYIQVSHTLFAKIKYAMCCHSLYSYLTTVK